MRPTELNALLTVATNYLYASLDEREFTNLAIFLSLLSREMLTMESIRELCRLEKEDEEGGSTE